MDFVGKGKLWLVISTVFIVFACYSMITKGFNFGIDFTGGTSLVIRFANPAVALDQVRTKIHNDKTEITLIDGKDFSIKTTVLDETQKKTFVADLEKNFGALTVLEADTVGPSIGKQLSEQALLIIALAVFGMLIYVTFRFEFWYGLAAVVALLHDCIITLGFASFLQLNINTAMIAAILTILGYSINDTIIVFDRVREEVKRDEGKGFDVAKVCNDAINSTLLRCINTVVTVLISCLALFFFGGATIKEFSQILLIGFTFGAYSSICVASPLYVWFKKSQE
jgi:preprotein translocase subunit SecF